MMRARGLLLGGACFAALAGANGGAMLPLSVTASALVKHSTSAAAATSPASLADAHEKKLKAVPAAGRRSRPLDVRRSNSPLDVSAVVSSVGPPDGPVAGGTSIVIDGTGFTDASDVVIGGAPVTATCPSAGGCFTFVNGGEIDAITPSGIAGSSDVTVDNPSFSGTPNPPSDDYTYLDQPTVSNVASPQDEGATGITVVGTGFSQPGPATSAVSEVDLAPTFTGPTVALPTECSTSGQSDCFAFTNDTHMPIDLPASNILPGQYDTVVTTPGGTSTTSSNDQFVVQQAAPTITSVTPDSGPEAGGPPAVTIHGTNFSGSGFTTTGVAFGGSSASFSVSNSTTIMATPPSGTGLVDISATTSSTDGTSVQTSALSAADTYVYAPIPTVTNVSPNVGPTGGLNTVTVTGTGFESSNGPSDANFAANDVFVDTTDITTSPCPGSPTSPCFTVTSPTQITVDMPAHAVGPVDVTVDTAGGKSPTSSADQYTFEPVPSVASVAPPAGALVGGITVTINGTGFTGATTVSVGTQAVSPCPGAPCFNVVSPTQITVDSFPPSGAPATVDITVTTAFGTSATSSLDSYTYMPIPTVTGVTPHAGSPQGGTSVTLTGTGFEFGGFTTTTVSVVGIGNAASFTVNSATSITIPSIPAGPSGGGMFNITVTTAGGTSVTSSANIYTYVATFPVVTTVSPRFGADRGGAYVTIIGANFGNPSQGFGATDVRFGTQDIPASATFPCAAGCFEQIGTTTLDVYTPSDVGAGTVDITVVTPGGTSNPGIADQYTFVAPGAYTAVNPFRICDTRPAGHGIAANQCNAAGKGTLGTGHETIAVQITGAQVPSGAQAVVVNITAINRGTGGTYVVAYPAGGSQPLASNINLTGGRVGSNLAIVRLGTVTGSVGQISLFNAVGSADVIVDVEGYFAAPAPSGFAGEFHSIPPLRICDSRGATGNPWVCATATGSSKAPLSGGTWRRIVLSGVPGNVSPSTPDIPANGTAAAAVFNLTATAGTAPTYLSVAIPSGSDACPTTAPGFSDLNPSPGISLPNRVISDLGPNQDICLFSAAGSINFVIDVNGWFGTSTAPVGAFFYSVPPTRICDTRPSFGTRCQNQALGNSQSELIQVAGIVAVPASLPHAVAPQPVAVAVVANLTGVAGTAATYFTLYPSDVGAKPTASDLNPSAGEVIANLTITSLAQTGATTVGNADLYNAVGTINALLDVAGWFQ